MNEENQVENKVVEIVKKKKGNPNFVKGQKNPYSDKIRKKEKVD